MGGSWRYISRTHRRSNTQIDESEHEQRKPLLQHLFRVADCAAAARVNAGAAGRCVMDAVLGCRRGDTGWIGASPGALFTLAPGAGFVATAGGQRVIRNEISQPQRVTESAFSGGTK